VEENRHLLDLLVAGQKRAVNAVYSVDIDAIELITGFETML
jgi:hypothetical protein